MRIELQVPEDRQCRLPYGYVFSRPVVNDISPEDPYKYVGLSLEEIKEKFGEKEAQLVYDHAALGFGDLTKPPIPRYEPGYTNHVIMDYVVESTSEAWGRVYIKVWAQPSPFNPEKDKVNQRCIWSGSALLTAFNQDPDKIREVVMDKALKQIFR